MDDHKWTEEELNQIDRVASWYVSTLANRGVLGSLHPLQAILGLASECYISNMRLREIEERKAELIAQGDVMDQDEVDRLNEATPTVKEMTAACGIFADTLSVNMGVPEADRVAHRIHAVRQVLAQVRLRAEREGSTLQ